MTILKHLALFLVTFATVTFTSILYVGQSANADQFTDMLPEGLLFAVIFLLFLATHEFGHYFTALWHNVRVSLPYFIPIPAGIGTLGAVIRIREKIDESRKLFDIGIAGPIAGFAVSTATLLYGFATLPGPEFIFNFEGHSEMIQYIRDHGAFPANPPSESEGMQIIIGNTLLYDFMASFFDNVPPMWEMYHYPFLFAGWLGLFFTALNLMPVGQLDGGHIVYGLLGFRKHRIVARVCFGFITTFAGIEMIPFLHLSLSDWGIEQPLLATVLWALVLLMLYRKGFHGDGEWIWPVFGLSMAATLLWLSTGGGFEQSGSMIMVFWSFILVWLVGLDHPPAHYEEPLSPGRRLLGWSSMAIFVLCISPNPIRFLN